MIRVFPLAAPYHNCGAYGQRGGSFHYGVDLCAPEGTPALAVDDGHVTYGTDPLGGNVAIVHANDGAAYYYAHLLPNTGLSPGPVSAGDTIAHVDHSGNAALTVDHLHFEEWPSGSFQRPAPDPTPALLATLGQPAPSPALVSPTLAAKALLLAWNERHSGQAPPEAGLTLTLAQAIGEGSFSHYFAGTNNWGAMHATQSFARAHAGDAGYGMVAFLDSNPSGFYVARMLVVPSVAIGALLFLAQVEADVGDLTTIPDQSTFATRLYVAGYYTGHHDPVTPQPQRAAAAQNGTLKSGDLENIADYGALIGRSVPTAAHGLAGAGSEQGDPTAVSVGPPFATLGERLTPSSAYAPHTVDHARTLLGAAATRPPAGGISLATALAAPGGDGVWLFGASPTPTPPGPLPPPPPTPPAPLPPGPVVVASSGSSAGPIFAALAATTAIAGAVWLGARI